MGKGIMGSFTLRFYQLLFASDFVLKLFCHAALFQKEGLPDELLNGYSLHGHLRHRGGPTEPCLFLSMGLLFGPSR